MTFKKKLIEVALPLKAINEASAREKSIRHGHPSTLHLWWARRPLAAARAVIFAQMVDDPSAHPDIFKTEKAQERERQRLFRIIEELVKWESTTNEEVLQQARDEIWQSWRYTCAENADHPRAKELFDRHKLPAFHDPFAGGGALPLEAQRLGLESYASDLNPVAVLINKAMIEIPPKFAGLPPMNPDVGMQRDLVGRDWKGAQGLADDVRYYGQWMRDEAEKRIGHLYPKIEVTAEMAHERPDLGKYTGQKLTVIAWLWARTVKSPNPAYADIEVPLASTFMLSRKAGKEAFVEPIIEGRKYHFAVRVGKPKDIVAAKSGTKLARGANLKCLMSGTPINPEYIKAEGKAGRIGSTLLGIVAESESGRVYLSSNREHVAAAQKANPSWGPNVEFFQRALGFRIGAYGMTMWSDLFSPRQLIALTTFSDLVCEVAERKGILAKDFENVSPDYTNSLAVYLSLAIDKGANLWSTLCFWMNDRGAMRETFGMQILSMVWDYAEANPFSSSGGNVSHFFDKVAMAISTFPSQPSGYATLGDARTQSVSAEKIISTDPPYYDNIGYADLSDFSMFGRDDL